MMTDWRGGEGSANGNARRKREQHCKVHVGVLWRIKETRRKGGGTCVVILRQDCSVFVFSGLPVWRLRIATNWCETRIEDASGDGVALPRMGLVRDGMSRKWRGVKAPLECVSLPWGSRALDNKYRKIIARKSHLLTFRATHFTILRTKAKRRNKTKLLEKGVGLW